MSDNPTNKDNTGKPSPPSLPSPPSAAATTNQPLSAPVQMNTITQQQQQNAVNLLGQHFNNANGLPFALIGASPLQQQLSALSGLTTGPVAPTPAQQVTSPPVIPTLQVPQQHQQQQPAPASVTGTTEKNAAPAPPTAAPATHPFLQLPAAAAALNPQLLQQLAAAHAPAPQVPMFGAVHPQQLQQLLLLQQLIATQGVNPLANLAALLGANTVGMVPGAAPQFTLPVANPYAMAATQLSSSVVPGALTTGQPMIKATVPPTSTDAQWAEPFSGKGKKEPPFPLKLHQILENPEYQDCICWNPHGRSWRILKPPVFEQLVIPLYFRHAKYASFMRQVNGWGFKRIVSGTDHNSYFHELFVRDNPQLCLKMKRVRKGEPASTKNAGTTSEAQDTESDPPSATEVVVAPSPAATLGTGAASPPQTNPNVGASTAVLPQPTAAAGVPAVGVPSPAAAPPNIGLSLGLNSLGAAAAVLANNPAANHLVGLSAAPAVQPAPAPQQATENAPVPTATMMTPTAAPPGLAGVLAGVDAATLSKLQEALTGGNPGILQPQASVQAQLPSLGNVTQNQQALGATALLAAQLQAATQPNETSNGTPTSNGAPTAGETKTDHV